MFQKQNFNIKDSFYMLINLRLGVSTSAFISPMYTKFCLHLNEILLLMVAQSNAIKNKEGKSGNKSRRAISCVHNFISKMSSSCVNVCARGPTGKSALWK